jgi:hypothetical protein
MPEWALRDSALSEVISRAVIVTVVSSFALKATAAGAETG